MLSLVQIILNAPALAVVVPLCLSAFVAFLPWATPAWLLALAGTAVAFLSALVLHTLTLHGAEFSYALGNWPPPWGIEFIIDSPSTITLLVLTGLALIATIFARVALAREIATRDSGKAYAAWLLCCGGLNGLALTGDAFNLFVFLEISALSAVILVALGAGTDRRALIGAYNYLVIGAVGATFYVIGVGFIYAVTGSLNLIDITNRLVLVDQNTVVMVGFGFMMAGLMVKSAIFPVHMWLPAAYAYAPSAVSVLLAAIATKVSLYVMARLLFGVFDGMPEMTGFTLQWVLMPLALAGIFIGTLFAIYENDVKKLLAFSSVAQIGYIALGFAIATGAGVAAGFIHIINHAMIKGGMFLAVGGFAVVLGRRIGVENLAGLGRRMPITTTAFVICGLSLMGLPLTAGFISKFYLVGALIEANLYAVLVLVLVSSALSVVYLWKMFEILWNRGGDDSRLREHPMLYVPLWIIALANIWFGVAPAPVIAGAVRAATAWFTG